MRQSRQGTTVQAVIAIPNTETLNQYGGPAEALMRKACGVPLLVRVIKTALRAGADSLLMIWPADVPQSIWMSSQAALGRECVCGIVIVQEEAFEPRQKSSWAAIAGLLDNQFLWLPWNWVTTEETLASLKPSEALPTDWRLPTRLKNFNRWLSRQAVRSRSHTSAAPTLRCSRRRKAVVAQ
jgi:hypothetical protein